MQKQWLLPIGLIIAMPITAAIALHIPIMWKHPDTTLMAAGMPIIALGIISFVGSLLWSQSDWENIDRARKENNPRFNFPRWTKAYRNTQTWVMCTSIPLTLGAILLSARVFYEG